MTKITKLQVSNVKRLRAVQVKPDGSLVIVAGDNAQGKSSVLDSIMYALGGTRGIPDEPLRKGAKRGTIRLELDNGLTVERTFKKSGSSLKVFTNDDDPQSSERAKSPQALLDKMYGQMSFDPLAFSRMKPAEQVNLLRGMVPKPVQEVLDKLKRTADTHRENRKELKRDLARLEVLNLGTETEPTEIIDTRELADELSNADELQATAVARGQDVENLVVRRKINDAEVVRMEGVLVDAREKVQMAEVNISALETIGATTREDLVEADTYAATARLMVPDKQPLIDKLSQAGEQNSEAARAQRRNEAREERDDLATKIDGLTEEIESLVEEREKGLESAALPVDGLSFDESGVRFAGQPWEQASASEQLRVSVAMGIALNPELKVLLIRDGSLLDEKSLAELAEMAAEAGAQVWLEMVGDRADAAVVIEDGMVQAQPEETPVQREIRQSTEHIEKFVEEDNKHEQRDRWARNEEGVDGPAAREALGNQNADTGSENADYRPPVGDELEEQSDAAAYELEGGSSET